MGFFKSNNALISTNDVIAVLPTWKEEFTTDRGFAEKAKTDELVRLAVYFGSGASIVLNGDDAMAFWELCNKEFK